MKALILAAGYATRLYPITKDYPKPLLKVGKRPIADYLIEKLEKLDKIDEIIVITNSKFIGQFKRWAKHLDSRKTITLIDDLTFSHQDKRGAIGDMHFAIQERQIADNLLVIGGDNIFDRDLNDFLSFAQEHAPQPVIGIYDIKNKKEAVKYGVIKLDDANRIIDFKEKPELPSSTLVAMCLYYFPKEKLGLIEKYLNARIGKHDATGFYIDWLRKQEKVYGFIFSGHWYDIGHRDFYHRAHSVYKMKLELIEQE